VGPPVKALQPLLVSRRRPLAGCGWTAAAHAVAPVWGPAQPEVFAVLGMGASALPQLAVRPPHHQPLTDGGAPTGSMTSCCRYFAELAGRVLASPRGLRAPPESNEALARTPQANLIYKAPARDAFPKPRRGESSTCQLRGT